MGITLVMDIEDYWIPTINHPAYNILNSSKIDAFIKYNLHLADNVITTTVIFANEFSKLNNNVIV